MYYSTTIWHDAHNADASPYLFSFAWWRILSPQRNNIKDHFMWTFRNDFSTEIESMPCPNNGLGGAIACETSTIMHLVDILRKFFLVPVKVGLTYEMVGGYALTDDRKLT